MVMDSWHCSVNYNYPLCPTRKVEKVASFFHEINPLWTKLVQSRWLDIGNVLCFVDATLSVNWFFSITYCIFWDLIGSDKLSYIL